MDAGKNPIIISKMCVVIILFITKYYWYLSIDLKAIENYVCVLNLNLSVPRSNTVLGTHNLFHYNVVSMQCLFNLHRQSVLPTILSEKCNDNHLSNITILLS